MCNKAVDNYPHTSEFVPNCFMTQKLCVKAVNSYPSTIKSVSECFMTQELCDKAVNICFIVFSFVPDCYRIKEMRDFSEDPLLTVHCPDNYKTQRMCEKGADDSLAAFKLNPIGLFQVK